MTTAAASMPINFRRSEAKRGPMNTGIPSRAVLVIDDDEVMRELLFALLTLQGDMVEVMASGETALRRLRGVFAPAVVLTDLQMPGLEGAALITALRQAISPQTLLIGMSGSQPSDSVLRLLDAFIAKPFATTQLREAIASAAKAKNAMTPDSAQKSPSLAESPDIPQASPDPVAVVELAESKVPPLESLEPLDETIFTAMAAKFHPQQLRELYTLTLDDIAKRHVRMEQYALVQEVASVQREAHSIKGLCGMVGARELQHLATLLEGGTTLNTSVLADFPPACLRLRRMLDAKFQVT